MQHRRALGTFVFLCLSCLVLSACTGQSATPTFSTIPARLAITPSAVSPSTPIYTATAQPPITPTALPLAFASTGTPNTTVQQHGATLPQLAFALTNTQAIHIRDDWDSVLIIPPYHQVAHYDLEPQGEHFVGQATFSLAGSPGNTRHANVSLLVPGNIAQTFFGLLAAVEVREGIRQLTPTKRMLLDTTDGAVNFFFECTVTDVAAPVPAGGASLSAVVPMQSPRSTLSRRSTCSIPT